MPKTATVLVIAYFFPPDATGVRRLLSHLKYWPELGIEPVILTCKPKRGAGVDASVMREEWFQRLKIVQTESWDPYRLLERIRPSGNKAPESSAGSAKTGGYGARVLEQLRRHVFLPDDRAGWIRFAVAEGERLIREHQISAIYTSNYPQSAHVVGLRLKERTGVRWVADFRDGWTQNPAFFHPQNALLANAQRRLERCVARAADELITVSPPITRHLQQLRGEGKPPAQTIFNGYDPSDFPPLSGADEGAPFHPGCLTLLYAGTFFGGRNPRGFFRLVAALRKRSAHWRSRLRLRFRCALSAQDIGLAQELGLLSDAEGGPCLEMLPSIPFSACCREQQRAEALLLVLERGPGAEIMVSQKVFEYLGAQRPIFAQIPEGAAAEVLRRSRGACIQTAPNSETALQAFEAFLNAVERREFPLPSEESLRPFHRREQALSVGKCLLG